MLSDEHKKYPIDNLLNSLESVEQQMAGDQEFLPDLEIEFGQVKDSINQLKDKINERNRKALENFNRHLTDKRKGI